MKMKKATKRRKAVADALRNYRLITRQSVYEVAKALGWDVGVYAAVEAGMIGRSHGQMEDVRKLLRSAIGKSIPAECHWQNWNDRDTNGRSEGSPLVECGPLPPGDSIAGTGTPDAVTCRKCRLSPAWAKAALEYGRRNP